MATKAKHGTVSRYRYGCRCEECRAAKARYKAEYTSRKKSGDYVANTPRKPPLPLCMPIVLCMARDFRMTRIEIAKTFDCDAATITTRLIKLGYKPGKNSNDVWMRTGRKNPKRRTLNHKMRAIAYGVEYERGITIEKLIERDGARCHICGCVTDKSDERYTPEGYHVCGKKYPTIDHVVPMSKGGSHTWDNVRVACHKCNSVKGNNLIRLSSSLG